MAVNREIMESPGTTFVLNNRRVEALPGETILQCAQRLGTRIPHLCYKPGYRPDGNCRACMVEIKGERVLAPSCMRTPTEDMVVTSTTGRSLAAQKMVLELLLSDMPAHDVSRYTSNSELDRWVRDLKVGQPRFPERAQCRPDLSNPAIAVNLDACIQCTRCVRACREEQVNDVIGLAYRGSAEKIVFDMDDEMGSSTCVSCGECVQACPTGALMPSNNAAMEIPDKQVDSVCPYCGVGCLLTFNIKGHKIAHVSGRNGSANHARLCVKGRYGFDYIHHPDRLTRPLIRKQGCPKTTEILPQQKLAECFREASWEEALDVAAAGLTNIRENAGPAALAGFGSAKGSNEEAYLFQKLVRTGFGTNNVDHCTRLCHASSVAALLEMLGSGAVSNPVADVADADVIIVIGARPTVNHPVAATFMKNAAKAGAKLILMDPYRSDLARHADHYLQFRPDTDVPMLNSLMYTIIKEDLYNKEFVTARTEGFEKLKATVMDYSPETVAPVCGIDAETLKTVARTYATARAAIVFWGMGISQHTHGTDNARCLISLALLTGQIGRPGTGLHPLRGQNNVQGASDVGLIPMVYPDYQPVNDQQAREKFESLWHTDLDPRPGLTVVEIVNAIHDGTISGMYIMGENPAMSDPDLHHARSALKKLKHLVVQDIFFTETASFADVVLPASAFPEKTGTFTNTDRRVQLGRQAVDPPGDARQDLWIIQEMARRIGLDWPVLTPEDVFEEMRLAVPSIGGMTWERLEREESLTYPLPNEGDAGEPVIFTDSFPTDDGLGRFVPAQYKSAEELPDGNYPFVFTTGRILEHWHTGSMTRRASMLDALEPIPVAHLHPDDIARIGAIAAHSIKITSRRGEITALARSDHGVQRGTIFMAFCFREAAANLLTNPVLDPYGKIPEFKFCAVKVEPVRAADSPPGDTGNSMSAASLDALES